MGNLLGSILYGISKWVFAAIPALYSAFNFFAKRDFFSSADIKDIWNHLYVLLSVLVLFAIAIKLINAIVNPDVLTDNKKGVKKAYFSAVIAVFLTVLTPYLFSILNDIEENIIDNNVIEKQLFGYDSGVDGGNTLAWTTITSFIDLNQLSEATDYQMPDGGVESDDGHTYVFSEDVSEGLQAIEDARPWKYEDTVYQHPFLMALSGFLIAYELVLLVMDTALRSIKLGLLQMMVPIILGAYIFKSDILKNWFKEYIKTYIQIFLLLVAVNLLTQILRILPSILQGNEFSSNPLVSGIINMLCIFAALRLVKQINPIINSIFGTHLQGKGGIKGRFGDMAAVGGLAQQAWGALGNRVKSVGKGALNTGKAIAKAPGAAIKYHGQNFLDKKFGTKPGAIRAKAWGQGISAAVKSGDPSKFYATRDEKLKSPSYLSSISANAAKGIKDSGVNEHGVYNNLDANNQFKTNEDHRNDANTILNQAGKSFAGAKGKKLVDSMGARFKADQKTNLLNGIKSSRDKVATQLNNLHSSMASSGLYDEATLSKIDTIAKKFEADGVISKADADVLSNYLSEGGANLLASTYGKMTRGIIDAKNTFTELKDENLNGAVSLGNNISTAAKESDGFKADEESMLENMTAAEKAQYKVYSAGLSEISATTAGASQNDKNIELTGEDSWAFLDTDHKDANDYVAKTRAKAEERQANTQSTSSQSGSSSSDSSGGSTDTSTPPETLHVDGKNQQDYFAAQNEARIEYLNSKSDLTDSEKAELASLTGGATGERLKARKEQQNAAQDWADNEGTLDE